MWRALALACLLTGSSHANIFTEGGGTVDTEAAPEKDVSYDEYDNFVQQQRQFLAEMMEEAEKNYEAKEFEEELRNDRLAQIIRELAVEEGQKDQTKRETEGKESEGTEEGENDVVVVADKNNKKDEQTQADDKEIEMELPQGTNEAPTAQKKGQNEFVSFVDPEISARLKDIPHMEKRKLEQVRVQHMKGDGGLLYLAVGTVMLVGVVGGAIGGTIWYRRRDDHPDDQEYAPYAGTGPRSKGGKGEKGDETLAYKAQLHHYQQAKQKIICGEENAGAVGDSEDEVEEDGDENNFSVYECPGLAPTGDIEVHNPNFAHQP